MYGIAGINTVEVPLLSETTALDKSSITLVQGTMMIAYNFFHMSGSR
jgi:hypothetical protein